MLRLEEKSLGRLAGLAREIGLDVGPGGLRHHLHQPHGGHGVDGVGVEVALHADDGVDEVAADAEAAGRLFHQRAELGRAHLHVLGGHGDDHEAHGLARLAQGRVRGPLLQARSDNLAGEFLGLLLALDVAAARVLDLAQEEGLAAQAYRSGGVQVHGARVMRGQERGGDGRAQAGLRGLLVQGLHQDDAALEVHAGAGQIVLGVLDVLLGLGLAHVAFAPGAAHGAAEGRDQALEALVVGLDGAGVGGVADGLVARQVNGRRGVAAGHPGDAHGVGHRAGGGEERQAKQGEDRRGSAQPELKSEGGPEQNADRKPGRQPGRQSGRQPGGQAKETSKHFPSNHASLLAPRLFSRTPGVKKPQLTVGSGSEPFV